MNRAPHVVLQPVYFSLVNVKPFDIPVATAVTFVGLIYLLVVSFIAIVRSFQISFVRSRV
jgi:hypothetical protein